MNISDKITFLSDKQIELLKKPLPPEAIKPHPTKQGMSAINAIHVVERLNDVFGIGAWQTETNLLHHSSEKKVSAKGREYVEYTCVVQTKFTIPDYPIKHCVIASSTNEDIGDAAKGAITDALTKIASWLGIGMDIWKARDTASQPQRETPDKPWLNENTPEFDKAKEWLKGQPDITEGLKEIRKKYAVSKKVELYLKA